ncbi:hypothetical protein [Borreliella bissettiae]|uniref:Uncharacterized protein n=1 Tax=Borrelia bissettiae TaxID=64897 RepID=A0A1L8ZA79_BORBI|nr:hypothetical protein [Borreliella bissettiae]OJH14663.1 hypothetical protein ER70_07345 [Borreliella bissettiae]WKD00297.1 hypothetical protein QIA02_04455 [Borreliella bissettiae]
MILILSLYLILRHNFNYWYLNRVYYIGKDNISNIDRGGRDKNNIDTKKHYRVERRLVSVFDNYFMLLNFRSFKVSGNNGELGSIGSSPIDS